MKRKAMARKVTNKKEADFYLSKGAKLYDIKNNVYYFDQEDTRIMRLEWKLKIC